MWRLRQHPRVFVWVCGVLVIGLLIAHESLMGLEFHLKFSRQLQSECQLKSVLVHSGDAQHQIPIEAFESSSEDVRLDIKSLPLERKRVHVEVEFQGCLSIRSDELVANRGDIFYVRIGDKTVEISLRSAGAWI